MKKILFLILFLSGLNSFAQNVKIEITDYLNDFEGKEYSTLQCANASSSGSRPTIIIVSDEDTFSETHQQIPVLLSAKQEYTDIWFLWIKDLDPASLTETDQKIIDLFYDSIIKYRNDNNLYKFDKEHLKSLTFILSNKNDLCKHFSCKILRNKK